jgi:hypothetical protein
VKSARERAEEKHEEKLELVREQVRNGSLVIRQMTKEERRRYPRRSASPKRIAELEARTQPRALGKVPTEDARARGL